MKMAYLACSGCSWDVLLNPKATASPHSFSEVHMQSISPPHANLVATFIMRRKQPHEAYKYPTPHPSIVHKPHILAALLMSALPRSIPSPILVGAKAKPMQTPVVDLCRLNQSSTQRSLVLKDIHRVCRKHGYFQVVNHGISQSVLKGALEAASDFFALSKEAKGQFASDDIRRPVRYELGTKDGKARSFLKHYAHPLGDFIPLWPTVPPSYREKMGTYAIEARKLALQLMDAILESLGLDQGYLRKELEEGMQMLAVNGYPQFSQPDVMVGLFPHSDFGFITILHQSCHGLEVMDHDDKCWRAAPHQPEALHVHIGDHLEVLSNGEFKTLVHRAVLNPDNTRISIASIHGLSVDAKISPAKELLDGQQPKRYTESSFNDYLDYIRWKNKRSFIDSLKIGRP